MVFDGGELTDRILDAPWVPKNGDQLENHLLTINKQMNYTYQQIDEHTGRIALESRLPYNAKNRPTIGTMNFNSTKTGFQVRGSTIGPVEGFRCCLLHPSVMRGDLLFVKEMVPGRRAFSWRFFRVDAHFEPQPLDLPDREPTSHESLSLVEVMARPTTDQESVDRRIKDFLAGPQPNWLTEIVSRQITRWRTGNPEALLRLAPWSLTRQEIIPWVKIAPGMALAHLANRLTTSQMDHCVCACPTAAIQFAFEKMTAIQVSDAVVNLPKVILEHAAAKISDDDLRTCSEAAPCPAFYNRLGVPPMQTAIMLSRSFGCCWLSRFGLTDSELHEEIIISISEYSAEWLAAHGGRCASIFERLWEDQKLRIEPKHILQFLHVMPADQHEFLTTALAAWI